MQLNRLGLEPRRPKSCRQCQAGNGCHCLCVAAACLNACCLPKCLSNVVQMPPNTPVAIWRHPIHCRQSASSHRPHPVFPVFRCLALSVYRTDHVPVNIRSRLITTVCLLRILCFAEAESQSRGCRSRGALGQRSLGISEHWSARAIDHWSAAAMEHLSSRAPDQRGAGVP